MFAQLLQIGHQTSAEQRLNFYCFKSTRKIDIYDFIEMIEKPL